MRGRRVAPAARPMGLRGLSESSKYRVKQHAAGLHRIRQPTQPIIKCGIPQIRMGWVESPSGFEKFSREGLYHTIGGFSHHACGFARLSRPPPRTQRASTRGTTPSRGVASAAMSMSIPSGCDPTCQLGYRLRWPSQPFDAGDWIMVVCAGLAILTVIVGESVRAYASRQRDIGQTEPSRPLQVDDTSWSHEYAKQMALRRAALERAALAERVVSLSTQATVVFGIVAGLPYVIFVLAVLLPVFALRLRKAYDEYMLIGDRLAVLEDAREIVNLNLSTPFYRSDNAIGHIDEVFRMSKDDLYWTMREISIGLIKASNAHRTYTARQKQRMEQAAKGDSGGGIEQ